MKTILTQSPSKIEANAVFIQPTYYCAENCKNCYVKAHDNSSNHIDPIMFAYLIAESFIDERFWSNQITLSLDTLPKDEYKRSEMLYAFGILIMQREMNMNIEQPEFHITTRSLRVFKEYCEESFPERPVYEIAKLIDMISFSNIMPFEYEEIRNLKRYTKINYNYLVRAGVSTPLAEEVEALIDCVSYVYVILDKQSIGGEIDIEKARNSISSYLDIFNWLSKNLHKFCSSKLIMDTCIEDGLRNIQNNSLGCPANVSKFQVWPDGTVSGCPYAKQAQGTPTKSTKGILNNMHKARKHYDFKKCYIPNLLRELNDGIL